MNKAEFIKAVAAKADLSIKDATAAVDAYAAVIAEALKAGDKVAIANFASYEVKEKSGKTRLQSPHQTTDHDCGKQSSRRQIRQSVQGFVQLIALIQKTA